MADIDEQFTAYVRDRGEHHLRVAALLTGDWHAAEDLVQASLVKLYRAWPKLRSDGQPDAYLRRIMVKYAPLVVACALASRVAGRRAARGRDR